MSKKRKASAGGGGVGVGVGGGGGGRAVAGGIGGGERGVDAGGTWSKSKKKRMRLGGRSRGGGSRSGGGERDHCLMTTAAREHESRAKDCLEASSMTRATGRTRDKGKVKVKGKGKGNDKGKVKDKDKDKDKDGEEAGCKSSQSHPSAPDPLSLASAPQSSRVGAAQDAASKTAFRLSPPPPPSSSAPTSKLPCSALQQSFLSRLSGSRFRELNERLYTSDSSAALRDFAADPSLFASYHAGFRAQVERWPVNPVHVVGRRIISLLKSSLRLARARGEASGGARSDDSSPKVVVVVADFGCGDAALARRLMDVRVPVPVPRDAGNGNGNNNGNHAENNQRRDDKRRRKDVHADHNDDHGSNDGKNDSAKAQSSSSSSSSYSSNKTYSPFQVHSFDLVSNGNPLITPCDMSNVPLPHDSVDIAVFCLSLMGTNIHDFINEAHRVLRPGGQLIIAEVRSRFESTASSSSSSSSSLSSSLALPSTAEKAGYGMADVGDRKNMAKMGSARGPQTRKKDKKNKKESKAVNDDTLRQFLSVMTQLGFANTKLDRRNNTMFVLMEFIKDISIVPSPTAVFTAKPCLYKRR